MSHYPQKRPMDGLHIQQSLNVGSTRSLTSDSSLCSMFMQGRTTCIAWPLGRPTEVTNPQHVTKFGASMFIGHAQHEQARSQAQSKCTAFKGHGSSLEHEHAWTSPRDSPLSTHAKVMRQ
jgi:hypothetical protein